MTTPVWEPGTLYQPGDIVRPASSGQVTQTPPDNESFENGLTDWDPSFEFGVGTWSAASPGFDGISTARWLGNVSGTLPGGGVRGYLKNQFLAPVRPGMVINFSCRIRRNVSGGNSRERGGVRIYWYDENSDFISYSIGNSQPPTSDVIFQGLLRGATSGGWIQHTGSATAPVDAAFAQFVVVADSAGSIIDMDDCRWDYTFQGVPDGLVFRAVQALAGFSGASEPAWPTVNGQQVVDNEVTWEAIFISRVVWEASPILVSGLYEPDFPAEVDATVADGTIAWQAIDARVQDEKCPQSKLVVAAGKKVFAADGDIISFCATVNPLDWSSENDAGYLPFGLNKFGDQPVTALGEYRTNVVAFSESGMQMWQVDPDPQNMAILDAVPVPCTYPFSLQGVANDLIFLTKVGIRSIGIAAASTNLQAGEFGKGIDPLVLEAISNLGTTATFGFAEHPIGLYWPGAGQYWLFFGSEAFVFTVNNSIKDASWSRYVFPEAVDYWTIHDGDLWLRAGDNVWRVSPDVLADDVLVDTLTGGTDTPFSGYISWPYLDFGAPGADKTLEAFDLTIDGICDVQIGYNQKNFGQVTDAYEVNGDTLPDEPIGYSVTGPSFQLRLTFSENQRWKWESATLYIGDTVTP